MCSCNDYPHNSPLPYTNRLRRGEGVTAKSRRVLKCRNACTRSPPARRYYRGPFRPGTLKTCTGSSFSHRSSMLMSLFQQLKQCWLLKYCWLREALGWLQSNPVGMYGVRPNRRFHYLQFSSFSAAPAPPSQAPCCSSFSAAAPGEPLL